MYTKEKFLSVLDKITSKLLKMDKKSFMKLMKKHKKGKYAKILLKSNIKLVDNNN